MNYKQEWNPANASGAGAGSSKGRQGPPPSGPLRAHNGRVPDSLGPPQPASNGDTLVNFPASTSRTTAGGQNTEHPQPLIAHGWSRTPLHIYASRSALVGPPLVPAAPREVTTLCHTVLNIPPGGVLLPVQDGYMQEWTAKNCFRADEKTWVAPADFLKLLQTIQLQQSLAYFYPASDVTPQTFPLWEKQHPLHHLARAFREISPSEIKAAALSCLEIGRPLTADDFAHLKNIDHRLHLRPHEIDAFLLYQDLCCNILPQAIVALASWGLHLDWLAAQWWSFAGCTHVLPPVPCHAGDCWSDHTRVVRYMPWLAKYLSDVRDALAISPTPETILSRVPSREALNGAAAHCEHCGAAFARDFGRFQWLLVQEVSKVLNETRFPLPPLCTV